MLVMKFGGSSVADRKQIEKVLGIVRGRAARAPAVGAPPSARPPMGGSPSAPAPVVVVSSAHKGITNALIAAGRAAARGEADAGEAAIAKQSEIARSLGAEDALLAPFFAELHDLLRGVRLVK